MTKHWHAMRRMIDRRFILMWLVGCGGCQSIHQAKLHDYRTVIDAPNRDEARAAKLNQRARKEMEKGHVDKAEQTLQESLIADVSYGPAHNNLGKIYLGQGKHYLAAWEFEFASRTMPDLPEPVNNLGLVYEKVNRLDEAALYYESAYAMRPTSPEFIGNLARVRLTQDEHDPRATPLLQELIQYDTRPEWVRWARDLLGRHPQESLAPPARVLTESLGDPMSGDMLIEEVVQPPAMIQDGPADSGLPEESPNLRAPVPVE